MKRFFTKAMSLLLTVTVCVTTVDLKAYAMEETIVEETVVVEESMGGAKEEPSLVETFVVESTTEKQTVEEIIATEEQSTTEESSEEAVTEKQSTTKESVEEAVTEEQPTTEESVEEAVTEEQSTTEESVEEAVTEESTITEESSEETKTEEGSSEETLIEEQSTEESTEETQSGWDGETTQEVYVAENFKVTFHLDSYWDGAYNALVKIENIGDVIVEDWYLDVECNYDITNIWNAVIHEKTENGYIIKNASWNQDILVGGCVEFGFSGNGDFSGFPKSYELLGTKVQVKPEDYSIEYRVDSDWGSGFTANIQITNNTEIMLEDWILEFDFDREITNIWNAMIVVHEGNHYVVSNAGYNANIAPGQIISFGFNGNESTVDIEPKNMKLHSYKLEGDEGEKEVINYELDTDYDKVPDYIEEILGMNIYSSDSDEDGLSDYVEICYTGTDPIYKDTDQDGIEDGKEDADQDGFTNLEELSLQTDLSRADTDGDLLSDYEEVKVYKTNPLIFDTDGDGAGDGIEISFGTNPLVADKIFNVHAVADTADTVKVSLDIQLLAEQLETLEIQAFDDEFLFPEEMPGYIGNCYDFSVDGSFENATIHFEFDSTLLKSSDFQPAIYYFNEEEQTLELLETTINGNVASATTTHFSKYILLNRKVYEDTFTWQDVWNTTGYNGVEIVLVIDDSGSLGGDYAYNSTLGIFKGGMDPEHKRLEVARDFVDNSNHSAKIGIIKFDGVVDDISGGLIECNQVGKEKLKNHLQFTYVNGGVYNRNGIFDSRGTTYMYSGIQNALQQFSPNADDILKVAIVFTDGQAHDRSKHSSVIRAANELGVKIYTVGLGNNNSYFTNYLKPLAQNTGGAFYYAADASELSDIYKEINEKIDIETDSDGDGITDYYEENMVMFNGVSLELNKDNPDTDHDGVLDGAEVCELNYKYNADKTQVIVTGKVKSNPSVQDTDYDGRKDDIDKVPLSGLFKGTMFGYYDVKDAQYIMDFREFFENGENYDSAISSSSLTFANAIYKEGAFEYALGADGKVSNIEDMLKFHGFENVVDYKLSDDYSDDNISEIGLGVHEVSYNGQTKKILAVVVRGTNGTIEEWSSNFDMGDPDSWNSEYHKGFYLTEERILSYVNDYVANNIQDTSNLTYWITGHSRGAALSNILAAKLLDEGKEVFAYTFATPSTTISSSRKDEKYNSIFNIVNPRDVVAYVPLSQWGFGKFGKDITLDIGSLGLDAKWCERTGQSNYNALEKGLLDLALSRIVSDCASSWDEVFDYAGSQNISDEQYDMISSRAKRFCKIEERKFLFMHAGYKVYPSLAFFLQLASEGLAGSEKEKENVKKIIGEFWNSKCAGAIISILFDIGFDKSVALPEQLGEFLVGDGHAPATYYVLINDSDMCEIR